MFIICTISARSSLFIFLFYFFFCKQKTAYEMRISDWSSDVCSSDLTATERLTVFTNGILAFSSTTLLAITATERLTVFNTETQIGRASCRERVCQYV